VSSSKKPEYSQEGDKIISNEEVDKKMLDLNRRMDRIKSQSDNPRDSQYMYLRGIKDGIQIAFGRKVF